MFNLFKGKDRFDYKPTKGDYVVVFHTWFVYSLGWEQFVFKGVTYEEVLAEALKIKEKKSDTFCHVSYRIIEWKDNINVVPSHYPQREYGKLSFILSGGGDD